MIRSFTLSLIFLIAGLVLGWVAHSSTIEDGPQFQFVDAAERGDISEMKRLKSSGVDPLANPFYSDMNDYGSPAVVAAALAGEAEALELLLEWGANPNEWGSTETLLDMAIHKRDEAQESVDLLKSHGAKRLRDVERVSELNKTQRDVAPDR